MSSQDDIPPVLQIRSYSVRSYPHRPNIAQDDPDDADVGYMILWDGLNPPKIQYQIHFVPDGTPLDEATYDATVPRVEMWMNWSQYAPLLRLLTTAASVQATYTPQQGDNPAWADVEGQYPEGQPPARMTWSINGPMQTR